MIAGLYGLPADRRFDVIGKTVNTAAMLAQAAGKHIEEDGFHSELEAHRDRSRKARTALRK